MESILNTLTSNKILLFTAILSVSVIIYLILNRLIKIIVIIIIAITLYIGYMNYKGEKIDSTLQNFLNKGEQELKEIQLKGLKNSSLDDKVNNIIR